LHLPERLRCERRDHVDYIQPQIVKSTGFRARPRAPLSNFNFQRHQAPFFYLHGCTLIEAYLKLRLLRPKVSAAASSCARGRGAVIYMLVRRFFLFFRLFLSADHAQELDKWAGGQRSTGSEGGRAHPFSFFLED